MSDGIILLDLETTGPDPENDRIVQLGLGVGMPGTVEPRGGSVLVDPGMPIDPEATEVHGISDEDVAGEPPFGVVAKRVQEVLIENDYLVTYSGRTFDVPILDRELRRFGHAGVDASGIREIDLYAVWCALEPRNLETAARRFGGDPDFDPHDAWEDARILGNVMDGLIEAFSDQIDSDDRLDALADLTTPEDAVDRYGYFKLNDDGIVCFDFSDHAGDPVHEHPGMVDWMLGKDFPEEVLQIARDEVGR